MLAFLKRLFGGKGTSTRIDVAPAVAPQPLAASSNPATPAPTTSAAAKPHREVAAAPAAAPGTVKAHKAVTATLMASRKAEPVTVIAVQASGRKVVVMQPGSRMPRAFTRRADSSYRLAGAPDRSFPKLVVDAAAAHGSQRISTGGGIAALIGQRARGAEGAPVL